MRNLRHLFRRSGLLSYRKRRRRSENPRRSDATQRRLSNEVLEKRELLAGDMGLLASTTTTGTATTSTTTARSLRATRLGMINYMSQ